MNEAEQRRNTRRSVLRLGVTGLVAAPLLPALGACTSDSGVGREDGTAQASQGPDGATDTGSQDQGGGADVQTAALAQLADLPIGGSRVVGLGGKKLALTRVAADQVVAFSAICTHQGCIVAPSDAGLACPCHHSLFDARSGQVKHGPATRPLEAVRVTIRAGAVYPG